MEKDLAPKVDFNKVVTIRYKDPEEPPVVVCICENKPNTSDGIVYISPQAPVAKAILNRFEGEEVNVLTVDGILKVEIMQIV